MLHPRTTAPAHSIQVAEKLLPFKIMPPIEFHQQSLLLSENKKHHTNTLRTLHNALTTLTSSHHQNFLTINQKRLAPVSKLLAVRERAKFERLQKELRQEPISAHLAYIERRADLLQQPEDMSREFVATHKKRGAIFDFSGLRTRLAKVDDKNAKLRKDNVMWEEEHGKSMVHIEELEGVLGRERKESNKYRNKASSSEAELKRYRGMLADANSKLIAQRRLVELIGKQLGSELAVARGETGKLERVEQVLVEVRARAGQ